MDTEPTAAEPTGTDTKEGKKRGNRNTQVGIITSAAMQKTVTVAVDRLVQHPLYKKTMRKTSRFLAHDENSSCKVGDRVRIVETRPLSARKRWRVVEVLVKAVEE